MSDYGNPKLWDYAMELIDSHGENCEFLTVVECAPDQLGREITEDEARFVHDIVQGG
jgi:hypothetical protein